jgi:beta-N-acetylhexosaminidase
MEKSAVLLIVLSIFIISAVFASAGFSQYAEKIDFLQPASLIKPVQKQKIELSDSELKEKIGQMIMVGFHGSEADENSEIYKIIKEIKSGGVALFDSDLASKSSVKNIINPGQTKKLISTIQKFSETPLFVAVDAEGGNVLRLKEKDGFIRIVSAQEMGKDASLETTRKESEKLSNELSDLGFNMNFAPVVDLNISSRSIIGLAGRSFSSDENAVFQNAKIFIEGQLKNNIIAVAKHFPGLGSSEKDSHLESANVTNTYESREIMPYKELNKEGAVSAVMAGHITNKKVDGQYPASLSKVFLQDILKNEVGFNGLVISDDMQMKAISENYGLEDSVVLAINAGCDVVTFLNNNGNYDAEVAYKVRDAIFNAVKKGKISQERITESYNKIIAVKKQFAIISSEKLSAEEVKSKEIRSKEFELLGVSETPSFGEVLDLAKEVEKFTGVRPAFLLAIMKEELSLEKTDMCYLTNFKTGAGVKEINGKNTAKVMKPDRDIAYFLEITKRLGKDPSKTLITCPMSFGWGGAMGPADFIPSTWKLYEKKIEKITDEPSNPWDIRDAFLAAGLYLADSGASSKKSDGEWKAAMIYFSGVESGYNFYAEGVKKFAEEIQKDIDVVLEK